MNEDKYITDLKNLFGQTDLMITEIASMEQKVKDRTMISDFADMQYETYPENPIVTLRLALQRAKNTLKIINRETELSILHLSTKLSGSGKSQIAERKYNTQDSNSGRDSG